MQFLKLQILGALLIERLNLRVQNWDDLKSEIFRAQKGILRIEVSSSPGDGLGGARCLMVIDRFFLLQNRSVRVQKNVQMSFKFNCARITCRFDTRLGDIRRIAVNTFRSKVFSLNSLELREQLPKYDRRYYRYCATWRSKQMLPKSCQRICSRRIEFCSAVKSFGDKPVLWPQIAKF